MPIIEENSKIDGVFLVRGLLQPDAWTSDCIVLPWTWSGCTLHSSVSSSGWSEEVREMPSMPKRWMKKAWVVVPGGMVHFLGIATVEFLDRWKSMKCSHRVTPSLPTRARGSEHRFPWSLLIQESKRTLPLDLDWGLEEEDRLSEKQKPPTRKELKEQNLQGLKKTSSDATCILLPLRMVAVPTKTSRVRHKSIPEIRKKPRRDFPALRQRVVQRFLVVEKYVLNNL